VSDRVFFCCVGGGGGGGGRVEKNTRHLLNCSHCERFFWQKEKSLLGIEPWIIQSVAKFQ